MIKNHTYEPVIVRTRNELADEVNGKCILICITGELYDELNREVETLKKKENRDNKWGNWELIGGAIGLLAGGVLGVAVGIVGLISGVIDKIGVSLADFKNYSLAYVLYNERPALLLIKIRPATEVTFLPAYDTIKMNGESIYYVSVENKCGKCNTVLPKTEYSPWIIPCKKCNSLNIRMVKQDAAPSVRHGVVHKRTAAKVNGVSGELVWDYIVYNEITFDGVDGNCQSLFTSISDKETEKKWDELVRKYGA